MGFEDEGEDYEDDEEDEEDDEEDDDEQEEDEEDEYDDEDIKGSNAGGRAHNFINNEEENKREGDPFVGAKASRQGGQAMIRTNAN